MEKPPETQWCGFEETGDSKLCLDMSGFQQYNFYVVLWSVTPCGILTIYESFEKTYRIEVKGIIKDKNKRFLRNISNHLRHRKVSQQEYKILRVIAAKNPCLTFRSFTFQRKYIVEEKDDKK